MSLYLLYRHVRADKDEVFYIGIGKASKTYNRSTDKRRNPIWKNITNKTEYQVEVMLTDLTYAEALDKEQEFIKLYGKIIDGTGTLANILDCGTGAISGYMSDQEKENLRKRMSNNQYAKGYQMTDEQRQKRSALSKTLKNNLGKTWSASVKEKMSKAHKGNTATKGYRFITDGKTNKRIPPTTVLPDGYRYGRTLFNP